MAGVWPSTHDIDIRPVVERCDVEPPVTHKALPFRGVENDTQGYLALDSSSQQIRYIAIDPGIDDAPVSCFLGYLSLQDGGLDRVSYEAVSYCWGEVNDTVNITLRCANWTTATAHSSEHAWTSQQYKVTRNLDSLLRAFRLRDKHRILWVDAICINQSDPAEKTHQVGSMGSIYSSASGVLVWLGKADLFSDIMMETYRIFTSKLSDQPLAKWYPPPGDDSFERPTQQTMWPGSGGGSLWYTSMLEDKKLGQLLLEGYPNSLRAYGHDPDEDHSFLPERSKWHLQPYEVLNIILYTAECFFRRPWFHRIWVLQEIVLAPITQKGERLVMLFMGQSCISWNELVAFAHILRHETPSVSFENHNFFNEDWSQLTTPGRDLTSTAYTIDEYIQKTILFTSSDSRDRLFAILQLSSDTRDIFRSNNLLQPDYTKPLTMVLGDYRRWQLEKTCQVIHPSMIDPGPPQEDTDDDPIFDETLLARLTISETLHSEDDDSAEAMAKIFESVGATTQDSQDSVPGASDSENSNIVRSDDENTSSRIASSQDGGLQESVQNHSDPRDGDPEDLDHQAYNPEDSEQVGSRDEASNPDTSSYVSTTPDKRFALDYIISADSNSSHNVSEDVPLWVGDIWAKKVGYEREHFQPMYGEYNASHSRSPVLLTRSSGLSIAFKGISITQIKRAVTPEPKRKFDLDSLGSYLEENKRDLWLPSQDSDATFSATLRRKHRKAITKFGTKRVPRMFRGALANGAVTFHRIPLADIDSQFRIGGPPLKGTRVYVTRFGRFVLCPASSRENDIIVVLFGCRVPLVLHPVPRKSARDVRTYQILGPCFFHGNRYMKGEELSSGALDHVLEQFYHLV